MTAHGLRCNAATDTAGPVCNSPDVVGFLVVLDAQDVSRVLSNGGEQLSAATQFHGRCEQHVTDSPSVESFAHPGGAAGLVLLAPDAA